MLQIDHVYEFFDKSLFKDFTIYALSAGIISPDKVHNLQYTDFHIFNKSTSEYKIFFYDQEPVLGDIFNPCLELFTFPEKEKYHTPDNVWQLHKIKQVPKFIADNPLVDLTEHLNNVANPRLLFKTPVVVTSEKSNIVDSINTTKLYYFFHGFAALDWYRGYYALNYNSPVIKNYNYDFVSYNRIIHHDRSYRIYFVSLLKELGLLEHGQVSFNVTDNGFDDWQEEVANNNTKLSEHARNHAETHLINVNKLIIDSPELPGSASADIPRGVNALWHIVTETVFYYPKLHLTEKIFKPIVSKQPFMLLAAPGNLAYLRNYGFKTFDGIIDESYDLIHDNDQRTEAVVQQIAWYCALSAEEKQTVIEAIAPIVEYNFHHFYGEFKHIITKELLDNTKELFNQIGYNDTNLDYKSIYHVLTN